MKTNVIGYEIYRGLLARGFLPDTAKYIVSQSVHETGNFTSKIFKENNNLFGMKMPEIRETTAKGSKYGHAIFGSIEGSLDDYTMFWRARKMPAIFANIGAFVAVLKKKAYFEDSEQNYLKGLINAYNTYFNVEEK